MSSPTHHASLLKQVATWIICGCPVQLREGKVLKAISNSTEKSPLSAKQPVVCLGMCGQYTYLLVLAKCMSRRNLGSSDTLLVMST